MVRRRRVDDDEVEVVDLEDEARDVGMQIARLDSDLKTAKASLDHCDLQIRFWRLQQGIAADRKDDARAGRASEKCELWEKRRGEALRNMKHDLYERLMAHIATQREAADKLSALTDADDDDSNQDPDSK
jgi:hypothetical protein